MKTATRIYRVNDTLIRAATPAAAVHHLVKQTIQCRVATQEDILELRDLGFEIQEAGKPWKEQVRKVELKATLTVDPGAADAMVRAAGEAAAVPGATEGDIEGAALAAVRIETEGRTGLRITLADDEPRAELTAGEDPAVLGSDDPAVLVTGELQTTAHHPV